MSTTAQAFGTWLAQAAADANYDLSRGGTGAQRLADAVGISRTTLARALGGESIPSAERLAPLARALNVPADVVLAKAGIIPEGHVSDARILEGIETAEFPIGIEEAAKRLGIPTEQHAEFSAAVERLRRPAE